MYGDTEKQARQRRAHVPAPAATPSALPQHHLLQKRKGRVNARERELSSTSVCLSVCLSVCRLSLVRSLSASLSPFVLRANEAYLAEAACPHRKSRPPSAPSEARPPSLPWRPIPLVRSLSSRRFLALGAWREKILGETDSTVVCNRRFATHEAFKMVTRLPAAAR